MKRLAIIAFLLSGPMTGTASAQSLLDAFLAQADTLSASITNLAQNQGDLDGSIHVDSSRDWAKIHLVLSILALDGGFGSEAQVNEDTLARDFPMPDRLFEPGPDMAQVTLKDLLTTGLGAMQSGTIDVFFDSRGLATISESHGTNAGTTTDSVTLRYGAIDPGVMAQNIAYNTANLTSRVEVVLNDVVATTGSVATTAIGAMGTGDVAATLLGRLVGERFE
ncbi:hypothetical protein [Thalassovita sp.]|uniref:hypothetical protein n=1 Tax=Thalassovita sp. TaxID=1979401 RepID=UPI0029DE63BC|nr:hypothetical protein [Thalassovita sp.]